jgi:hypothetical protein
MTADIALSVQVSPLSISGRDGFHLSSSFKPRRRPEVAGVTAA